VQQFRAPQQSTRHWSSLRGEDALCCTALAFVVALALSPRGKLRQRDWIPTDFVQVGARVAPSAGRSTLAAFWAWRPVGHSHNAFVMETPVDELAHAGNLDPVVYPRGCCVNTSGI
jgi:CO/xanthine dehydrogenase Mo-binding subunit